MFPSRSFRPPCPTSGRRSSGTDFCPGFPPSRRRRTTRGYPLPLRDNNDGNPFGLVVNVDTGMGREGVLPEGLDGLRWMVAHTPGIVLTGVVTPPALIGRGHGVYDGATGGVRAAVGGHAAPCQLPLAKQRRIARLPGRGALQRCPSGTDALRFIAAARTTGAAAASVNAQDASVTGARVARRPRDKLRTDVRDATADARGHAGDGLRRRLPNGIFPTQARKCSCAAGAARCWAA